MSVIVTKIYNNFAYHPSVNYKQQKQVSPVGSIGVRCGNGGGGSGGVSAVRCWKIAPHMFPTFVSPNWAT